MESWRHGWSLIYAPTGGVIGATTWALPAAAIIETDHCSRRSRAFQPAPRGNFTNLSVLLFDPRVHEQFRTISTDRSSPLATSQLYRAHTASSNVRASDGISCVREQRFRRWRRIHGMVSWEHTGYIRWSFYRLEVDPRPLAHNPVAHCASDLARTTLTSHPRLIIIWFCASWYREAACACHKWEFLCILAPQRHPFREWRGEWPEPPMLKSRPPPRPIAPSQVCSNKHCPSECPYAHPNRAGVRREHLAKQ